MHHSFDPPLPADSIVLAAAVDAANAAISLTAAMTLEDEQRLSAAVLRVAVSGYARSIDGSLDMEALAQAAVVRFRSVGRPDGRRLPARRL